MLRGRRVPGRGKVERKVLGVGGKVRGHGGWVREERLGREGAEKRSVIKPSGDT